MPDTKISALTDGTTPQDADEFAVRRGSGNAKLTFAQIKAAVPGAGIQVATSRTALASDNGLTLELASGITYTLSDAVALPAGVAFQGPASGSAATIAVTGSATTNGATSGISVPVGKMATAIPRASAPAAFLVSVQA